MVQSSRIVIQALRRMPEGPHRVGNPKVFSPSRSEVGTHVEGLIHHFKLWMDGHGLQSPAGAEEAAQADHSYDRFLLALSQQEIAQRERNHIERRIKAARFPVLKELAEFDFSCISSPNKQRVLELAQGSYIHKAEPIILVGNPGLGKTRPS